jgi:hypothetical protein
MVVRQGCSSMQLRQFCPKPQTPSYAPCPCICCQRSLTHEEFSITICHFQDFEGGDDCGAGGAGAVTTGVRSASSSFDMEDTSSCNKRNQHFSYKIHLKQSASAQHVSLLRAKACCRRTVCRQARRYHARHSRFLPFAFYELCMCRHQQRSPLGQLLKRNS